MKRRGRPQRGRSTDIRATLAVIALTAVLAPALQARAQTPEPPKARELVASLDTGEGVLIFSDIYGATPCNLAVKLLVPARVEGVAGVNLPMLVRAFTYRAKGMDTMIRKAISGGCDGVLHLEAGPVYAATRG